MLDVNYQELGPVPHRIYEARRNLGPYQTENKRLLEDQSRLWREPPHPHELAILTAYIGLMERDRSNLPFFPADRDNLATLFRYVQSLEEMQVTTGQHPDRCLPPPLVQPAVKEVISQQLDQLNNKDFLDKDGWDRKMLKFLKMHVETLREKGLLSLNDISELNETIVKIKTGEG